MGLPPFSKLNSPDALFSRGQDNVASSLQALGQKQLVILGETAVLLEATVTVPTDLLALPINTAGLWQNYSVADPAYASSFYRKTLDGITEVFLMAQRTGGADTVIATLPAAYRHSLNQPPYVSQTSGGAGRLDVASTGEIVHGSGGVGFVSCLIRFPPTDRFPVPASCWPIQLPCSLPARPEAVLLASAVETASGARVAAANPDWDWETQQGVNFVIINNVPLLPPGAEYNLTFLAIGEQ